MRREKFQDQLRKSFIGYAGILVAAMLLLYLGSCLVNYYGVVIQGNREDNSQLAQILTEQMDAYTLGLEEFSASEELLQAVSQGDDSSRTEANRRLYAFANAQNMRPYFVLMNHSGKVVCSNFSYSNQKIFAESIFVMGTITRMRQNPDEILQTVFTAQVSSAQACCYSLCKALVDPSGEIAGYLLFNIRQESFVSVVEGRSSDVLLTDRYDNVIYTTLKLPKDPQDKLPSGKYTLSTGQRNVVDFGSSHYYVTESTWQDSALRLYTLTYMNTHTKMLWIGVGLSFFLLVILVGMIWVLTRAFSQKNAMELSELKYAVEQLEQNGGVEELPAQCSEETQALYMHFRTLIRHNNALIDRRRQMEIKQMESQFNPHFVYNIMETIRYQMDQDAKAASRMLLSFAALMRYSINYGSTKVPLETDIEYINDYLLLQKVRFNNCLHYSFSIPEELLDCQIPKLLLQPVIENSIKHGYQAGKTLDISITAERVGSDLCFTVRDNGIGICRERLEEIREILRQEPEEVSAEHVGLYNVHKVVSLTYGSQYGLRVDSEPNVGTTVIIEIPYEMEGEEC